MRSSALWRGDLFEASAREWFVTMNEAKPSRAFTSIVQGWASPLRDWRLSSNLSQAEAAMVWSVGRRHLSRMENGLWPYPAEMLSGGEFQGEWFKEIPLLQIDLVDDRQLVFACHPSLVAGTLADLSSGGSAFAAVVDLDDVLIVRRSKIALVTELKGTGLCAATCDEDHGLEGTSSLRLLSPSDWSLDDRADSIRPPGSVCATATIDGSPVSLGEAVDRFVKGEAPLTLEDPEHGAVCVPTSGVDALMLRLDLVHPGFRDDEIAGSGLAPLSLGRPDRSADVISIRDGLGSRRTRR